MMLDDQLVDDSRTGQKVDATKDIQHVTMLELGEYYGPDVRWEVVR